MNEPKIGDILCQLENVEDNPLRLFTPAIISHECEYVDNGNVCQYGGSCEFKKAFKPKEESDEEDR